MTESTLPDYAVPAQADALTRRRIFFVLIVLASMVGLVWLLSYALTAGGFSALDFILVVLFAITLPWSVIGLDLREAPEGWDLIPRVPKGRAVALGLIEARNTRLEDAAEVAREVARARALRSDLDYQLSTTASLEYLPADKAEAKVARLAEAARIASRNGG